MMSRLLSVAFWVGYSKVSGLGRDVLLIALLGITAVTDAVFLGMTVAMFFQLTAYQAGINHLLGDSGNRRVIRLFEHRAIGITLITANLIVLCIYWMLIYRWGVAWSVTGFFLLLAPLALFVGLGTALCVLEGAVAAQAIVMSIQNTLIIITVGAMFFFQDTELLVMGWFFALGVSVLLVPFLRKRWRGLELDAVEKFERSSYVDAYSAFLIPSLGLSVGLIERWFYSNMEGALAFVKILETLVTSIIFVCQVLIYNKVLASLNKRIRSLEIMDSSKYVKELLKSFLGSTLLGLLLYVILTVILKFSQEEFFPEFELPGIMDRTSSFLVVGYGLYMVVWILREHMERLLMLSGMVRPIVIVSILTVILTTVLNYIWKDFLPISVLFISITLALLRSLYMMERFRRGVRASVQ